jgi:tetraacyldisaccharide 4'-kinase
MTWRSALEAWANRHWWQKRPSLACHTLRPIAMLAQAVRRVWPAGAPAPLPVPVIVVGNVTVGGAGKTPTVIAVVNWLHSQGYRPGVVSRGYGRESDATLEVVPGGSPQLFGDEPLLIARKTGVPLFVGTQRREAALALLAAHPDTDVIVSDDGLQHRALPRIWQVMVFDERGAGNGLTLPAGPLREPMSPSLPARTTVLYNASSATTGWPGAIAQRALAQPIELAHWLAGRATPGTWSWGRLQQLFQATAVHAMAGIASPERFFRMLESQGLCVARLPMPDHAAYSTLPWPASAPVVLVTEKDAVKLSHWVSGSTTVLVVPLDFQLPAEVTDALVSVLPSSRPIETAS